MPTSIVMPQLGETVAEGIISRWLKQEGDWVAKDEPLVEVVTDKVNAEIPSPAAGILSKITVAEGATVEVGTEIALLEEKVPAAEGAARQAVVAGGVKADFALEQVSKGRHDLHEHENGAVIRSSPVVRRLAAEHGIDLATVSGSGLGGRITREDVLKYIAEKPAPKSEVRPPAPEQVARPAPPTPKAAPPPPQAKVTEEAVPVTPVRQMIAQRMVRSKTTVPHVATVFEVDMTNIVRYREAVKDEFRKREGVELTFVPFVIRAVVETLKEYPILNSSWAEDKILIKKEINIGVAVASEEGVIVPVICDAGDKSLAGIARAMNDLVNRARAGKLTVDDVQGGTFTVNNTGAFGSIMSTPIINYPQAAIMTMEAIVKRPVVIDDAIAIRSMMNICLSFDHRITDGLEAGRFMQSVKRRLEHFDPSSM